ncbi:MAG: hypothetical protein AAF541_15500 [Pseudomonadota bacterium]
MKIWSLLVAAWLMLIGLIIFTMSCPCGPVPGLWLLGEVAQEKVTDWSIANDRKSAPLCQLQINTWRPHSINLNCMSDQGNLYVSCSNCAGKTWSNDALAYPEGILRIGETVYPVHLERLTRPQDLDIAWSARLRKIGAESAPRPEHWWSFRLNSS